jgi:hypothetical protein
MAESGLDDKHLNKCAHAGCQCMVEPSQHFCSEHCAKASGASISGTLPGDRQAPGGGCHCGHSACK